MLKEITLKETGIIDFFGMMCPKCQKKYCIPFTDRESYSLGCCCGTCSTVLWHDVGENSITIYDFQSPSKISNSEFHLSCKYIYIKLMPPCPVCGEKKWIDYDASFFKRFLCVYCNEHIKDEHGLSKKEACQMFQGVSILLTKPIQWQTMKISKTIEKGSTTCAVTI